MSRKAVDRQPGVGLVDQQEQIAKGKLWLPGQVGHVARVVAQSEGLARTRGSLVYTE